MLSFDRTYNLFSVSGAIHSEAFAIILAKSLLISISILLITNL